MIQIDPVAVDVDGFYTTAVVSASGALTLDGVLDGTTLDYARRIGIDSSGEDGGITFTIVGTDADGRALTEAVTGGASTMAESAGYFKTITSITASGAAAANVTIGTVDEFITNTIPLNVYNYNPATVSIEDVTGTIDISVEETYSKVFEPDDIQYTAGPTALTTITAAAHADLDNHATGIRLVCNSYSTGAELKMIINQDGV